MPNETLARARGAKNDEFYTQYHDIEKEVNAYLEFNQNVFRDKIILLPCDDPEWSNFTKFFALNFKHFGLKKLISTCYAIESQNDNHGKILVLEKNDLPDRIDFNNLKREYLKGDGDFRSEEVSALRDEADIIITNPPFSLFRDFLAWIMVAEKHFLTLGNMNAVSYKEVFPLIKENMIWLGVVSGAKDYLTPSGEIQKMGNTCWFTNIEHGRRHQPLPLMPMADNLKFSKHKEIQGRCAYIRYENYDAIEVPYTDAIPSDYDGIMGVPKSFLDKYCPEQFEIIGCAEGDSGKELGLKPFPRELKKLNPSLRDGQLYYIDEDGIPQKPFARILIRKKL